MEATRHAPLIAVVTTTVATAEDADHLAALMVQRRLAACVQVEQVVSHYRWQDALHREAEWRLSCKTAVDRADALQLALAQEHPYEVPQLLMWTVQAQASYAQWVGEETRQA